MKIEYELGIRLDRIEYKLDLLLQNKQTPEFEDIENDRKLTRKPIEE